jgi:hypothetical protein
VGGVRAMRVRALLQELSQFLTCHREFQSVDHPRAPSDLDDDDGIVGERRARGRKCNVARAIGSQIVQRRGWWTMMADRTNLS